MTRKTFTSNNRTEPLEFEVSTGDVFHARPKIPAGVLLRFAAMTDGGDEESGVNIGSMAGHMVEFMRKAISKRDRDRFLGMLKLDEIEEDAAEEDDDEDEPVIDLSELIEIATWLAGEYSGGRPTGTASENGSPETATGPDSTVGLSPGVTTYSRPDPIPVGSTT